MLQAAGDLWRDWRAAHRRPIVLRPYVDLHSRWRLAARFLVPAGLGLFCVIYGFIFAITAPYLIVPLAGPIAVLGLLAIWALPENNVVPTKAMEFTFAASIIGLVLWPNYLALTLPGLPWITIVRLTGFPMAFFLLISLSMSPTFRHHIAETTNATPLAFRVFLLFTVNEFISIPFTHNFGETINKILIMQLNWTCVFLICLYIFRKPGRPERYLRLLLALTITIIIFSIWEAVEQKVLWGGSVPSFLRVEDPAAQRALAGAVRGATGQYRTKFTFATALGLSEFISLMTPFALHWAVGRYSLLMRLTGLALIPTLYFVIRLTDSRLGVVGYLVSCLIYLLFWSLVRWRHRMGDILSAAVVYAYPTVFLAAVAATMFVHKIHVLVFGGGSTAASNEARGNQFKMAIPALLKNPIGHGAGQSGLAMGYGANDFIAIDSYYINIGLDFGVLGLALYVALFAMVIGAAVTTMLRSPQTDDREASLLLPLATCVCAFLVIRGVYGQPEIHPIIFMVVGMVIALVNRIQQQTATSPAGAGTLAAEPPGPPGPRPGSRRT
jgi:hypothetical protein